MKNTPAWIGKNQKKYHLQELYKQACKWQEYAGTLESQLQERDSDARFFTMVLFCLVLLSIIIISVLAAIIIL